LWTSASTLANFRSYLIRPKLSIALASSEREVAVLDPVVGPASNLLLPGVTEFLHFMPGFNLRDG
jgi:hypothetical protein